MSESRFAFGANWARFLSRLTPERVQLAETSLRDMLGDLSGKRFLDIGSGSGLFSLAARNLGATVHSFDYDPQSVACTAELRRRFYPDDRAWRVERGSALDEPYLRSLGAFDVVYAWGVLHHTGEMWRAMELATIPLAPGGLLYVAVYTRMSPIWHRLVTGQKRLYVRSPAPVRWAMIGGYGFYAFVLEAMASIAHGRHPLARVLEYEKRWRGMSWWHDIVDWVGGYPYESASPSDVFDFYRQRGLTLTRLVVHPHTANGEYVFASPQ
jgi:2-polyprenyl-6-hydroxyphenyl methylase/3-demethylubiquinone-9 3-methyltransferase